MTSPRTDHDLAYTQAAAEGQGALAAGDTDRARECFGEAGRILESRLPTLIKPQAKSAVRFQAAVQYYRGGHYARALNLARKVESRLLSPEERRQFEHVFRDIKERGAEEYEETARNVLQSLWEKNDCTGVLAYLQDHPYILPAAALAFCRGNCCEELKDFKAASAYYSSAIKGLPEDAAVAFSVVTFPLVVLRAGQFAEACQYADAQLQASPSAATQAMASLMRFHQAARAEGAEREKFLEQQEQEQQQALRTFGELPASLRNFPTFRAFLLCCMELTAFGQLWRGKRNEAEQTCKEAIAFGPQASGPRVVRGLMTYPGAEARADFQEAVSLGEAAYHPYFYLAHAALVAGDLQGTANWCRRTLAHRPNRAIESQITSWLAFIEAQSGKDAEAVAAVVREAAYLGTAQLARPLDQTTMLDDRAWLEYIALREGQLLAQRNGIQ